MDRDKLKKISLIIALLAIIIVTSLAQAKTPLIPLGEEGRYGKENSPGILSEHAVITNEQGSAPQWPKRREVAPNEKKLSDLNKQGMEYGTYQVEGYIAKIYTCPPCAEFESCKPCMQDNIVLSEKKKFLENYDLSDEEIIIFVDDIEQFQLGKKYKILIQILDLNTTGQKLNNIKRIYHEEE